jgi:hypothetical protein
MSRWTPQRIAALRAMSDEFLRLLDQAHDTGLDEVEAAGLDLLVGSLAAFVPELLDEIERLQQKRGPEQGHFVKFDAMGGRA